MIHDPVGRFIHMKSPLEVDERPLLEDSAHNSARNGAAASVDFAAYDLPL
jgi:hypothetical protein